MQFNLITLAGIALAAMFFGYFFGLFEGRGQGAKKRKNEEEQVNTKSIFEPPLPPPSPPVAPLENNLLALSLNEKNQPQLKLDGRLADPSQLSPENRKRLIELMIMMRPWIDTNAGQKQAAPVPAPQPAPRPMIPVPAPAAVKQPSAKAASATTVPVPAPEPAPTSMVTQIDAILQTRLVGTPLENVGIRLIESPIGDPVFLVGDQSYKSVGEVTDPAVQTAFKAAIAEWERKYTPGY